MIDADLRAALRSIVRQHGFDAVDRALQTMHRTEGKNQDKERKNLDNRKLGKPEKRRPVTALDYVLKMDLPPSKKAVLVKVAERYRNRSFLPTIGDIRNFHEIYRMEGRAPASRPAAVPKVFKFMAKMNEEDIEKILEGGAFSGPARLGPIADAIRATGREFRRSKTASVESGGRYE